MVSPIPGVPYISIHSEQGTLSGVQFQQRMPVCQASSLVAEEATKLLGAYFTDSRTRIPILKPPQGTPFQQRVWRALQQIPPGETRRYGELAQQLGSSARAVAGACRANPMPLLIPCHRVVSANGLGGYMGQIDGQALEIKRWLLHHEDHV